MRQDSDIDNASNAAADQPLYIRGPAERFKEPFAFVYACVVMSYAIMQPYFKPALKVSFSSLGIALILYAWFTIFTLGAGTVRDTLPAFHLAYNRTFVALSMTLLFLLSVMGLGYLANILNIIEVDSGIALSTFLGWITRLPVKLDGTATQRAITWCNTKRRYILRYLDYFYPGLSVILIFNTAIAVGVDCAEAVRARLSSSMTAPPEDIYLMASVICVVGLLTTVFGFGVLLEKLGILEGPGRRGGRGKWRNVVSVGVQMIILTAIVVRAQAWILGVLLKVYGKLTQKALVSPSSHLSSEPGDSCSGVF